MLSIQCDDNTAAAIIVDDATEISMTEEDWEISGRPTIGDTISFDVTGEGAFVDAFNGMRYLITDERKQGEFRIISFVEVSCDGTDDAWFSYDTEEDVAFAGEDGMDGDDESMDFLRSFPGIVAPDEPGDGANEVPHGQADDQVHQIAIKNMPSMRLIGALMQDHGMSMHEIAAGLVAMENETASSVVNEDVIVDFFQHNSESIRDISDDFAAYSSRISNGSGDATSPIEPSPVRSANA